MTNEQRPEHIATSTWKNRYMVGAKLTPVNHKTFLDFCKENKLNYSSGINYLIANYLN
tara:strand:- start:416 stop:589 length:174 start_codon:yes stop_codon:yes gene_type:complete